MNYEDFLSCFKKQIEQCAECDGDFLKGETIESRLASYRAAIENVNEEDLNGRMEIFLANINRNIDDYANHVGDKQVYYMIEPRVPGLSKTLTVYRAWASELNEVWGKISELNAELFASSSDVNIPRFLVNVK